MAGGIVFRFGSCVELKAAQVDGVAFGEKVDFVAEDMAGQCPVLDLERCVSAICDRSGAGRADCRKV
jgi:hypothetical protein